MIVFRPPRLFDIPSTLPQVYMCQIAIVSVFVLPHLNFVIVYITPGIECALLNSDRIRNTIEVLYKDCPPIIGKLCSSMQTET